MLRVRQALGNGLGAAQATSSWVGGVCLDLHTYVFCDSIYGPRPIYSPYVAGRECGFRNQVRAVQLLIRVEIDCVVCSALVLVLLFLLTFSIEFWGCDVSLSVVTGKRAMLLQ